MYIVGIIEFNLPLKQEIRCSIQADNLLRTGYKLDRCSGFL